MSPLPSPEELQVWQHYEQIAMHFNQLLMQYRLQLMGGLGAIGALAGYLIGEKMQDSKLRNEVTFWLSLGIWILVFGAAFLDLGYYNKLLRGAVDELLAFEKDHPSLHMSTRIEATVGYGRNAIWVVYTLVLIALGCFVWRAWKYRNIPEEKKAHSTF